MMPGGQGISDDIEVTSSHAGGRIDLERARFWREQLPPQTTNALRGSRSCNCHISTKVVEENTS